MIKINNSTQELQGISSIVHFFLNKILDCAIKFHGTVHVLVKPPKGNFLLVTQMAGALYAKLFIYSTVV